MLKTPSFWLYLAAITYPFVLFGHMILVFPPPWWPAEVWVFTIFVLPSLLGTGLLILRLNGAKISWMSVFGLPVWMGLVNWLYVIALEAAAAAC
ncbi:MAG TPA: hypothetical protein PLN21_03570 [Gemmatales bacterium]|nr:hypothetical protein [Gemmatales bacterium]